ncbi:hypothetical protein ABNX05_01975 [Lysinibacillus sp. M3]|uniref:Uncharacterized protein n=1 Tax=Lysinibacillus zambalensis TaxID=3160866 RepID=A0ABV1MNB7_9BACI
MNKTLLHQSTIEIGKLVRQVALLHSLVVKITESSHNDAKSTIDLFLAYYDKAF